MLRRLSCALLMACVLSACKQELPPTEQVTPASQGLTATLEGTDPGGLVDPHASFIIRFSQPMSPTSARPPISARPQVPLRVRWSEDYRSLSVGPQEYFEPGSEIVLKLDSRIRSEAGDALAAPHNWSFRVIDAPHLVKRPSTTQSAGGTQLSATLLFSQPMDHASVESALQLDPALPVKASWSGMELRLESMSPPEPSTSYEFRIGAEAVDIHGVPLVEEVFWSYLTRLVAATATLPSGEYPDAPVVLRFNYALDAKEAQQAFYIDPAVPGSTTVTRDGLTLTFKPDAELPLETTYEVGFKKPVPMAGVRYIASIPPKQFTLPGYVAKVFPAESEELEPPQEIWIRFTREMDRASVERAFAIEPPVRGSTRWQDRTFYFTPEKGQLVEGKEYTVVLGSESLAANGAATLLADYRWSFTTVRVAPLAYLNAYGPNLQVLEPGANLPLGFHASRQPQVPLRFNLYALTKEQFADLYAHHFEAYSDYGSGSIPARGAVLDRTWLATDRLRCDSYSCDGQTRIPGTLDSGLYLLELEAGGGKDSSLLVVSDIRLAAKSHAGQVLVWATDERGTPEAGVTIDIGISNGQLAKQGVTDRDGLFETWILGPDGPTVVIASKGDQISVTGLDAIWNSEFAGYGGWYDWWPSGWGSNRGTVKLLAHIHTDRPIYRPGQTVHYKALLRRDQDALVNMLPEGTPVTVEISDGRENILQSETLHTNPFGSVNGKFQLAEGVMLGDYGICVRIGDDDSCASFMVEDYRKPDYSVKVVTDADRYVVGDTITASLEATYFMGAPVAGASVTVQRYRVSSWWGWEEGDNVGYSELIDYEPKSIGTTDAQGRLTYQLKAQELSAWWTEGYFHRELTGLEFTLDDGSHQSVSAFTRVPVFTASERIEFARESHYLRLGQTAPIQVTVTDLDGRPVNGRELNWSLDRYTDDSFNTISEFGGTFTTASDGRARVELVFPRPGWYDIAVRGEDTQGNEMLVDSWFYVKGGSIEARSDSSLRARVDRDVYAPGDTAHLILESTFAGPALLTFERASVRRQQLIELTPPVTELSLPVRSDDVPNIYVVVTAWGPPDDWYAELGAPSEVLLTATAELNVPASLQALRVMATSDKQVYQPGESATFTFDVRDAGGRPVQAELSLALVDEAIFSLSEDRAPPLMKTFYSSRSHRVATYDSLAPLLAMMLDEGRGGGGGGPLYATPRADFPDTAIWLPEVVTDASGVATVHVKLPDNLTTWRLTVRGITKDSKVGETITSVKTRLPLSIRPLMPRFVTQADTVTLAAAVHNDSEDPATVRVLLEASGLDLLDGATRSLDLPPGASEIVYWTVEVTSISSAKITMLAESDAGTDSVQLDVPVHRLAVHEVTTSAGSLTERVQVPIEIPPDADAASMIRIDLSRDATHALLDGLEYLTSYPYGCVEQVMSAALPNAVILRAFRELGGLEPELEADLTGKVGQGLQRLYSLQHMDGGWGWWYDDETDAYQTAWVLYGLALTQQAGHAVDPGVIDRAANWLLTDLPSMDERSQAFALYSLSVAGSGQPQRALRLSESPAKLDPFALAALALSLEADEEDEAAARVLAAMEQRVFASDGKAHLGINSADGEYNHKTMASPVRATALGLSALVKIQGGSSPVVGKLVPWLMSQRKAWGWGSTNETSFAILGLTDYLLAVQALDEEVSYTIALDGEPFRSGQLTAERSVSEIAVPASAFGVGSHTVEIASEGGQRLYYRTTADLWLPRKYVEPAGSVTVSRAYLDPQTKRPLAFIQAGDLVAVRLSVRVPQESSFMIVEDHLPSGLEPLNERLTTTSQSVVEYSDWDEAWDIPFLWQDYGYNYKEIHPDGAAFFVTNMGAGAHEYTYLTRAIHPGYFTAQPAEAYAMYDAEVWGRSDSAQVQVIEPPAGAGEVSP